MTTLVMAIMAAAFLLASVVFAAAWVYKDAKQKRLQAGLWTLLVVLSGNFIGLILYLLIGRKQEQRICQRCGASTNMQGTFCSVCGEEIIVKNQSTKANKGLLFTCIACIVLAFISLGFCLYSTFGADGFTFERQYGAYNFGANGSSKNVSQKSSDNTWELSFDEASGGYVFEKTYTSAIEPLSLSVDIQCNGFVQLIVTQNDVSINETVGDGNYIFDMTSFNSGKISIKIINIDASNFSGILEMSKTE